MAPASAASERSGILIGARMWGGEEGSNSEQRFGGVGRDFKASCCFLKVPKVGAVQRGNFLKSEISKTSSIGTGVPGKFWSPPPWKDLKEVQMWQLGTWFSGGLDRAGLTAGLSDL